MTGPAIRVTVSDPDTGEVLETQDVAYNNYVVLVTGTAHLTSIQDYGNGTVQLTVKGVTR